MTERAESAKKEFMQIFSSVTREGKSGLIKWLETSDFFTAPASTKYHGNYEGGLCEHSVNVYKNLKFLCKNIKEFQSVSEETIVISALLHDVTKVNCYKADTRNVKNADGVWEKVPYYKFEEKFCYGGHGSKSVFLIERFMKLTLEEAVAINNHMGAWDVENKTALSNAYEQFPFAYLLHMADGLATYVDENNVLKGKDENEKQDSGK